MSRSLWKRALFSMAGIGLSGALIAVSTQAQSPGSAPSTAAKSERVVTLYENGKSLRCRLIRTWKLPDGSTAHQLASLANGETITLIEDGPSTRVEGKEARPTRIYHWGVGSVTPPPGVPTPPAVTSSSNISVAGGIPKTYPPVTTIPVSSGPRVIDLPDESASKTGPQTIGSGSGPRLVDAPKSLPPAVVPSAGPTTVGVSGPAQSYPSLATTGQGVPTIVSGVDPIFMNDSPAGPFKGKIGSRLFPGKTQKTPSAPACASCSEKIVPYDESAPPPILQTSGKPAIVRDAALGGATIPGSGAAACDTCAPGSVVDPGVGPRRTAPLFGSRTSTSKTTSPAEKIVIVADPSIAPPSKTTAAGERIIVLNESNSVAVEQLPAGASAGQSAALPEGAKVTAVSLPSNARPGEILVLPKGSRICVGGLPTPTSPRQVVTLTKETRVVVEAVPSETRPGQMAVVSEKTPPRIASASRPESIKTAPLPKEPAVPAIATPPVAAGPLAPAIATPPGDGFPLSTAPKTTVAKATLWRRIFGRQTEPVPPPIATPTPSIPAAEKKPPREPFSTAMDPALRKETAPVNMPRIETPPEAPAYVDRRPDPIEPATAKPDTSPSPRRDWRMSWGKTDAPKGETPGQSTVEKAVVRSDGPPASVTEKNFADALMNPEKIGKEKNAPVAAGTNQPLPSGINSVLAAGGPSGRPAFIPVPIATVPNVTRQPSPPPVQLPGGPPGPPQMSPPTPPANPWATNAFTPLPPAPGPTGGSFGGTPFVNAFAEPTQPTQQPKAEPQANAFSPTPQQMAQQPAMPQQMPQQVAYGYPAYYQPQGYYQPQPMPAVPYGYPVAYQQPTAYPANYGQVAPVSYQVPQAAPGAMVNPAMDRRAAPVQPESHTVAQAIQVLIESPYPAQREWAAQTLATFDCRVHPQVLQVLCAAARQDPAASVRAGCVYSLSRLGIRTEPVLGTLQTLRTDGDPRVRQEVEEACLRLGVK